MLREEQHTIELVKKISPAVVSIVISKSLDQVRKMTAMPFNPFHFLMPEEEQQVETDGMKGDQAIRIGGGSGFFVSPDGLILTNKHVVADKEAEYTVMTADENEHKAEIISVDPINDIAFLKIDKQNCPTLPLGDSSRVAIGQNVIAIGTALGMFTNSVSKGIISGLSRRISASLGIGEEMEELRGVIQTDVAINQGNSGGPLIDSEGSVLGINTAIIFGAQNIGFAIPVNWAKADLDDIKEHGRVIKPYLGLRYVMLTKQLKDAHKLTLDHGALVVRDHLPHSTAIVPDSPADKAGIKENDVILAINGEKLDAKNELADCIQKFEVGDEVKLSVLRNNKDTVELKLKLEERK